MTDNEFLDSLGLCHRCRREKAAPGRKFCFGCLEEIRKSNQKKYDPEYAKKYQARRREIYREKKKAGICVRCTKPATHGMYCRECAIKTKRRRRERTERDKRKRHERGLIPDSRKEEGVCLWCGKPAMSGTNVCEYHSKIFSDAGGKGKEKDKAVEGYWKQKKKDSESI